MNTILFDLDGTLIDSSEGIIKCVLYTLDFYGIKEPDTAKLYRFIGPPLSESFERYYGFSHEKAYEAVQKYRERYNTTGIFECKLYPGVEKCIRTLKEQGYRIGMASSKPEESCRRILDHFGILESNVHMAWTRTVCGRLKSDYRYSGSVVYNNFPWCNPTPEQKTKIEQTAQAILDARAKYPECSLADLYDETTMPPELRKAHQANDFAVMAAYGFDKKITESECVAELMKMYRELTSND